MIKPTMADIERISNSAAMRAEAGERALQGIEPIKCDVASLKRSYDEMVWYPLSRSCASEDARYVQRKDDIVQICQEPDCKVAQNDCDEVAGYLPDELVTTDGCGINLCVLCCSSDPDDWKMCVTVAWEDAPSGTGDTYKVMVSSDDDVPEYLLCQLVSPCGSVTITEESAGASPNKNECVGLEVCMTYVQCYLEDEGWGPDEKVRASCCTNADPEYLSDLMFGECNCGASAGPVAVCDTCVSVGYFHRLPSQYDSCSPCTFTFVQGLFYNTATCMLDVYENFVTFNESGHITCYDSGNVAVTCSLDLSP